MVTPYFLNLIAGNVMHAASVSALPERYYVALSTTTPDENGDGIVEVSGGGYSRGVLEDGSVPDNGMVSNLADVEYPEATAEWGTVKAFAIYDAASGGNLLAWDAVSPEQTVVTGNQVRFKPGALKLTLTAETA